MPVADRVWLGLDSARNLMMVTAVLEFAEPVDERGLRAVLAGRLLAAYPRFGQRIVRGRWPVRAPQWHDVDVDLDVHFQRVTSDGSGLSAVVDALLSRPLDLSRPPWHCHLVTGPAGDALVVRVHHAVADGIALAGVLLALTDEADPALGQSPPVEAVAHRPTAPLPSMVGLITGMAWNGLRLLALPREPRTELTGRPGIPKRSAWTPGLPLAQVRSVAAATGGSVNDVLLAVIAGALRRYLLDAGVQPPDLRVFVPVSVRPAGAPLRGQLGNRFGLLFPQLPVAEPAPIARVAAVSRQMAALKASTEAASSSSMIRILGTFPNWTHALAGRVLGSKATAVVTNVPGPRRPVRLAGAEVTRLTYWVPQVGSIGIGISIFSYAGAVCVGVATDAGLVPDPSRLTNAMTAEFDALRRALSQSDVHPSSRW
jgi:diacylglycerol O-acyltransferase / wax synthase